MTGGSVSDVDPVSAQPLPPAQPQEGPDALEAKSATPPAESQSAIRSAYVAHLAQADAGAGIADDLPTGSMKSAYVSHLSQTDAGAGGAHDLPAASMIRAIYAERSAAGTAPRAARRHPGKRAAPVAPKRKSPRKKAKASASPARRRKAKAAASTGKRRAKRPRR